jgi:hypothetical protein
MPGAAAPEDRLVEFERSELGLDATAVQRRPIPASGFERQQPPRGAAHGGDGAGPWAGGGAARGTNASPPWRFWRRGGAALQSRHALPERATQACHASAPSWSAAERRSSWCRTPGRR